MTDRHREIGRIVEMNFNREQLVNPVMYIRTEVIPQESRSKLLQYIKRIRNINENVYEIHYMGEWITDDSKNS